MSSCAKEVTACIPTFRRPQEVSRTIELLLAGAQVPGRILISEAGREEDRSELQAQLRALDVPANVTMEVLPRPPCGNRSGNRNWLAAHVQTPLVLFMDDDVDIHADFLADATGRLVCGQAAIVVASTRAPGGSGWLTFRGHYRVKGTRDPIAVGFQVSLWKTELYRSAWLDEALVYGYEDADISLRLHRAGALLVHQSEYPFRDGGIGRGTPDEKQAKVQAADQARCYVACRRYRDSRVRLGAFMVVEMLCNARRGRRVLPAGQVPAQWRGVVSYLVGRPIPAWAAGPPEPVHLEAGSAPCQALVCPAAERVTVLGVTVLGPPGAEDAYEIPGPR